jgi:hypothetical protein
MRDGGGLLPWPSGSIAGANRHDGEHNERQAAPVSQWHTTRGSKSNEALVISQTQNIPDLRASSRIDLASQHARQWELTTRRRTVFRVHTTGHWLCVVATVPVTVWYFQSASRGWMTHDASSRTSESFQTQFLKGCSICSGLSLKIPVSGKLQINKESRPARFHKSPIKYKL